jgi:hypothetical protein
VRESDPVAAWPIEDRLKRVRAGVMEAIRDEEPWTDGVRVLVKTARL